MAGTRLNWTEELERWLAPFLARLGHKARRRMCPLYLAGLIGPGDRKSVQPMAERLALGEYDQLHHFVSAGVWDAAPLEEELLIQADRLVGGGDAVLVIDDTALPKKGKHSVGVAPQYASALGKNANCQTLVSLTLGRGEVPVMVALRLFLPESWTSDRKRLERAGVPAGYRTARTKPEIALAEVDRVMAAGVRFGCVVADAGYGLSAPFRQGLTARGLAWAVGIPRSQKVYPTDVKLIFPVASRGRPRRRHIPDVLSIPAEGMLANAKWREVSWRAGTKGRLKARFAALRVRIADGPPQRIWDKGQQHLPGDEAWLIGEHRTSGEKKYYLANLPAGMDLRALAATIKARWVCEQAHQQLKEELGLDHFEGRSWAGLHRHALMTMIAYAFLQHRRLTSARRKKKSQRTTASTKLAGSSGRERALWTMDPELMAEWGRRGLQLATENMDKIVDLCREWQCKVTVVVYPWPDDVALGDRNSIQVTHWRDWAAARGARFIDGFAGFFHEPADETVRKYYIRGDTHFNAAGHRLLFDEVRSATTGDY